MRVAESGELPHILAADARSFAVGHAYVVAAPGNTAMGQPVSGGGATVVGTPFTPPTRGQAIEAVAVGTAVRPVR